METERKMKESLNIGNTALSYFCPEVVQRSINILKKGKKISGS
jgi:hypothetical protein